MTFLVCERTTQCPQLLVDPSTDAYLVAVQTPPRAIDSVEAIGTPRSRASRRGRSS